ncbi:MAG: FAD-dependent oxidoreductase [Deltaproteobacteria bacterium]|nr:FAD-dependent oxidoreductase [Deltaproteobacteria bacterium]
MPFEGTVAGADDGLGHRLRQAAGPEPARSSRAEVVVVGGGLAGLSAAWRLSRAGLEDYRVLELGAAPGGTSVGGTGPVTAFPWGAHYLPCPQPHARAVELLAEELGAARRGSDGRLVFDEAQLCRAPQERVFVGDRWYEGLYPRAGATARDREELELFQAEVRRLCALRDARGRRAFAVPMAHGSDDADLTALDRISMAEWLETRGLRGERIRWFVEYGCRDDYGLGLADTSAWAALHYHASRTDDGGPDDLLTWPEGNARIVAHLARRAGPRLATGALVTSVRPLARGAEVVVAPAGGGPAERITAGQVVLAVPRTVAARLLPHPRLQAEARAFEAGAWLVANLGLRRRPRSRGFPEAWDNVLHGSRSLGYVVATHQVDRHGGPPGATVWTWYLSLTARDAGEAHRWLLGLSWREAAELVVADLRRAHPDIEQCIERLDVWRWGHAMIRPRPGFVFGPLRRGAAEPLGDVHFAHTDLSGLPLAEEAQWHGIRAAEEILARRRVRTDSLL